MILNDNLLHKLVKYNKIQSWWIQLFDTDWYFKKLSKNKGKVWLEHIDTGQIIEWNVSDIQEIGNMPIEVWLRGVDMDENGNITRLEINENTDFDNDIKGKKEYFYKEIPFINDMIIILNMDRSPLIKNKMFKIKGVGTEEGIHLKNIKGRPRALKKEKEL